MLSNLIAKVNTIIDQYIVLAAWEVDGLIFRCILEPVQDANLEFTIDDA